MWTCLNSDNGLMAKLADAAFQQMAMLFKDFF